MAFSKLSAQEKDAFFGLLDEYFQSRPELLNGQGQGMSVSPATAAAATSAVQRFAVPAMKASLTSGGSSSKSNNPYLSSMPTLSQASEADVARATTIGRVAAASLAFSGGHQQTQPLPSSDASSGASASASYGQPPPPPPPPSRRVMSTVADRMGQPGSEVDKLVTRKTSLFSSSKKSDAPGASIPPAFVAPRNTFGPPPVRRQVPEPEPEQEPEHEREWAEVLYDYSSEDPGDLAIKVGERVLVTDKTSDDWWTGQVQGQGRQGLFPASYVKLM